MAQDEELSRLMMMAEQYKEQINQMDMQISYMQQAKNEYNRARLTIENLDKTDKNSDVLLPLGGGSYIDAKVKDSSKILVDIGAGYIAEKKSEGAVKKIENRIDELDKHINRLNEMKTKTEKEASDVYQKAQTLYQQQNK